MAQLSVADLYAITSGKPVPTPAPAPERGAREPDPVYYLLAPSLKRYSEVVSRWTLRYERIGIWLAGCAAMPLMFAGNVCVFLVG